MSIDTRIPGSPASVNAAAAWLETLNDVLDDIAGRTAVGRRTSGYIWRGLASDGYRGFAHDLIQATEETRRRAHRTADVFRSYALQLGWRQDDMARHRKRAVTDGLVVAGTMIHEPGAVMCPIPLSDNATPAQRDDYTRRMDDYHAGLERIDVYRDLRKQVRGTFQRLDDWIVTNLVDQEAQVSAPSLAGTIAAASKNLDPPTTFVVEFAGASYEHKSSVFLATAKERATQSARRASRNPEVQSGQLPPREAAVAKRVSRFPAFEVSEDAAKLAKRIGIVGTVISVAIAGTEIAAGASPSSTVVEFAGGVAGGVVVGAIATTLFAEAPALAIAGGVVLGGLFAADKAKDAFEYLVPQRIREVADEAARDAGKNYLNMLSETRLRPVMWPQ
ncbi:hypothetical protein GCM10009785_30780 [Brooklawnia cerclae]|uniref:Uncharacterized protein n=1 Tax=Brooklawnia cerclae TaxID=349934 RepID=A0ABX0SIR7_9ACTN|nr:hypothetical protein [Brooklawnia cerclae]NIH56631.1 hypothetical protein [Brooklawnia cerclae]